MLIKAVLLVFVWATTFQAGISIYFTQTEVTLKFSTTWKIHKSFYQVRALTEPDESGQIKYSLHPKNGKHCAIMNVSQEGQIFLVSQLSNLESDKNCNYRVAAELFGKTGMAKRNKANMTVTVVVTAGTYTDEDICKHKPDKQLCFGGIESLNVQVMENSDRVFVAALGYERQACSADFKYSAIATVPSNESEGIFTIEDREERSELWIESNLDREAVVAYQFSVICSVVGYDENVSQFVLPGILTVLDQDDNPPYHTSTNTSLATVSILLHSGKNSAGKERRLEPEEGHEALGFRDRDTKDVNHFELEIVNDTKQLLAINFSSNNLIDRDTIIPQPYTYVLLKAELRAASIGGDGMYCVLVTVNDISLVGNRMDSKISFNVCLHFGTQPTTTKLPLQESEKAECGAMCQVVIIVVFLGIVGGILVVTVFHFKMVKRKSRPGKSPVLINPNGVLMTASYGHHSGNGNVISTGMDYIEPGAETNALTARTEYFPVDSKWEVPRTALVLEEVLGEGEFGRVLKARFQNPNDPSGKTVVAVKMLKDNEASGRPCKQEFMAEFSLLKQVDHHNVIKLLGACTSGPGPFYLIMEFAEFKSLRSFLRKCRKIESLPNTSAATFRTTIFGAVAVEDNGWDQRFTVAPNEILGFSWQIAKGMAYLSDMKMVHRDLAARNVLLTSNKVCKISDFGLTRDIYVDDAYKKKSKDRVPVKWLAPECLADELYTTKSDVWAYGVLLWELANMGASPYPGIPSEQLYFLLKTGYRMPQPPNCSFQFYGLMRQCWADEPTNRPTFRHLVTALGVLLEDGIDYIQLNIPSVSNPAYEFYNSDSIPSSSADLKAILRSPSHPLFVATDESIAQGSDVSVENLRLIDHEISTCEDPSLDSSTEYNNTFVVHTYKNNEHKEETQTASNSSQGPSVPISSSAYESPIKIKSVSFNQD